MNTRSVFLALLCVFFNLISLYATHNRAGEITFKQISSLSIEVTITTYTKASSVAADRDSLELFWGDNTSEYIKRDNALTKLAANDVKINYYIAIHTYPGPATYTMYFVDPNRVSTILNINYPNSVDIPFFLSTTFTLLNQQFQGPNNSVILLQPPLDIACAGEIFTHNPNGFDPDGDSLVYELAVPLQGLNLPVPGYKLPDEIAPGPNNNISINSRTGEFIWDVPVLQGEYNIAIKILEYRKGQLINTVLRDMQILVRTCLNDPPTIQTEEEICIIAGEKLDLSILVNDINNGQKVKLFATGGPFSIANPGILNSPQDFTIPPFTATFSWQTHCTHIAKDYYQIVFRAIDNYFGDSSGLATLKTVRIKVVGPPPENIETKSEAQSIRVEWEDPYLCDELNSKNFSGFAVYRSESSIVFLPDTCNPGLENSGYLKIAIGVKNRENGKYFFVDNDIKKGLTYCYRTVAEFSLTTSTGLPFSKIEGLASREACIQLSRELPLITKVSVENTDDLDGKILVQWTKPLIQSIDTSLIPPPYTFEFYRSLDNINFDLLPNLTREVNDLFAFSDTTFIDSSLNTRDNRYFYKIKMFSKNGEVGSSQSASSVFAMLTPSDKVLTLSWIFTVPWSNFEYEIYRIENGNSIFIGRTFQLFFEDRGLENHKQYCYKVLAKGTYNIPGLKDTLFNFSQEICGLPKDNVPPCPTTITVQNPCDLIKSGASINELFNLLEWENVKQICPELSLDVKTYNIYFAEDKQSDFNVIMTIDDMNQTGYTHFPKQGLSGCYYMTVIDSLGNESLPSNVVCIENCPLYILPNTFTPNNDGSNDFFVPITNYFIDHVEFEVFNQWGNKVFKTNHPELQWDGKNLRGQDLASGVYHYTCRLFVKQVDGSIKEEIPLHGFVQIIR